MAAKLIRK